MSSVIPLHFRPTIVVCVGTAGKEIGEQLALLLPSLDPARRAGVALLAVEEEPFDEQGQIVGRWFDPDLTAVMEHQVAQSAFGGATTALPTSLPLLIVEALRGQDARTSAKKTTPRRGVLDDSTITRIQDDVSTVSKVSAIVWIAAAVESPLLAIIAESIRDAMESEHGEALVLLALANIPPHEPSAHRAHDDLCGGQPWESLLLDSNGEKAQAAFAYLFEEQGEQRTYWAGRYDVPFAAAEAIFVMTATGISITHEFEMSLRRSLPQLVKQPFERISSVGACRLTFPRAQAEQYCANTLGAELMREWGPQVSLNAVDEQSSSDNETSQHAIHFMSELNQQTRDSEAKKRGGRPSPPLSAAAMAQVQGTTSSSNTSNKPDGGLIFQHFNYPEFERFVNEYQDVPEVLAQQNAKAEQGFARWQHAVRMRWEGYEHEREHALGEEASEMMLQGTKGILAARDYMTELNHLIGREKERLATRREDRELAYEHFLYGMEDRAIGPWLRTARKPLTNTQAGGADARDTTWTGQLLEQLTQRYRWQRNRRPSVAAIIGAACSVVPAAALVGQAILPEQWFANNRLAIPLLALVLTLISGLLGWCVIAYQRRQEQQAVADLRQLYRRIHTYQCESYEDLRRAALLSGLHQRVRRLLDRLLEWSTFMASVAKVMEQDAAAIEQDLFEGAMGRRDVLIANRHVLRQHDYNLHQFEQDVSTKRSNEAITRQRAGGANGVADWHRSLTTMLPHLRHHLQGVNLLEVTPEELKHPVRDFALAIVRPQLSGDMVSIGAALEALPTGGSSTLFDRLVRQGAILYKPATPAPASTLFVAAREEFRQSIMKEDQAAEAVLLHIDDTEWLGVLRLQPGGAIPAFWPAGWEVHPSVPAGPSWQPIQSVQSIQPIQPIPSVQSVQPVQQAQDVS